MYKSEKVNNYINNIALSILFFFPLLPIKFIGFLGVFISIVLILVNFKKEKQVLDYKPFILSFLFYLLLVFSLIYSQNISEGLKETGKMILLIIFPVSIIRYSTFNKKWVEFIPVLFIIINIFLCIYIFNTAIEILAYKKMVFLKDANIFEKIRIFIKTPYNVPFNWSSRNFEIYLFFHKAYVSLSLCLSALMAIYQLLYKKNKIVYSVLLVSAIILIAFFIFYMQSVPNIIGFILGVLVVSFNFILKKPGLLISVVLVALASLFFLPNKLQDYTGKITNQVRSDFRNEIWSCGWEVTKSNFLLGVGIGDQEDKMLRCYKENTGELYEKAYVTKMNSHNQYLSFLIAGGFLCLLLFILLMYNNIVLSFHKRDVLFLAFIILILINFLFENILDRIYGIFFFALFNSFFIKRNVKGQF